ncbi:sodium hydrogen exchanger family protein, putative, partial [Ichthyophthirius multifiliis]
MNRVLNQNFDEIDTESRIIMFIILGLFISQFSKELNSRLGIPYTPILVVFGMIIGSIDFYKDVFDKVLEINPHGFLMIFFPVLIFSSSFNANLQVFNKNKWQIFYLAVPGVTLTIILLTLTLKYVEGYDDEELPWSCAMLLATSLSTTDPVAVVALLQELGAPLHLEVIIEMESLLNDGVAVVIFNIVQDVARGIQLQMGSLFSSLLSLSLGGLTMGFVFGI